jgi:hypothetical protein
MEVVLRALERRRGWEMELKRMVIFGWVVWWGGLVDCWCLELLWLVVLLLLAAAVSYVAFG